MEWYMALGLIGLLFVSFAVIGVPIAFAFFASILISSILIIGPIAGPNLILLHVFESLAMWSLVPIPLFILLGELLFHSGIASRAVTAFSLLLGRVPARESYLALGSGGIFSMLTGSTMANVSLLGTMLAPQMRSAGYTKMLTYGPILAAGGLAMIIPPSNLAVIWGSYAGASIGGLFIAGILPGLLLLIGYAVVLYVVAKRSKFVTPGAELPGQSLSFAEKTVQITKNLFPVALIIFLVTGLIMLGVATPTESAGMGVLGALLLVLAYRLFNFKMLREALVGTLKITALIFLILGGALGFSRLLAFSGATGNVVRFITEIPVGEVGSLLLLLGIVIVLGMFLESIPIIMITAPFFAPVADAMGWDPIWFGILVLLCLQVGTISPPFGMLIFVLRGIVSHDATLKDLYKAGLVFLIVDISLITAIVFFPSITTILPDLLGT